jgi:hypothetical protein
MNIANWYEGEPITDVRMNQIVNDVNSIAAGSVGLAVMTASGTWIVPNGITSDTRLRVWVAGGGAPETTTVVGGGGEGSGTIVTIPGVPSPWAYSVFTGFSAGQAVPITIGVAGDGTVAPGASVFNSVSLFSNGAGGAIGGTAPAGVLWVGPKLMNRGQGGGPSGGAGAIVIEW